ncbi:MAG: hypothetical protein LC808_36860, partial [Actinobacteria bacterium]|nr:hypothetical protein [Actinomycetota bacterium]
MRSTEQEVSSVLGQGAKNQPLMLSRTVPSCSDSSLSILFNGPAEPYLFADGTYQSMELNKAVCWWNGSLPSGLIDVSPHLGPG